MNNNNESNSFLAQFSYYYSMVKEEGDILGIPKYTMWCRELIHCILQYSSDNHISFGETFTLTSSEVSVYVPFLLVSPVTKIECTISKSVLHFKYISTFFNFFYLKY